MPDITSIEDELRFAQFQAERDRVRNLISQTYFSAKPALEAYTAFAEKLLPGDDKKPAGYFFEYLEYNTKTIKKVQPWIEQIQTLLGRFMQIVEGIERMAPGTFNVPLPYIPDPEPEPLKEDPNPSKPVTTLKEPLNAEVRSNVNQPPNNRQ